MDDANLAQELRERGERLCWNGWPVVAHLWPDAQPAGEPDGGANGEKP